MIIVDNAGSFLPAMNHSPWEGVTIADFVMPFFIFIVGVALALAYKRVPDKLDATRKATLRALKLFCVGLVLQGGFFHGVRSLTFGVDIAQIHLMGILQRIAIAYLVTTLCQIWLKGEDDVDSGLDLIKRYRYQLFAGLLITITYMALLYGTYVPNWEYRISGPGSTEKTFNVKCSVRGDSGRGCNAVGMIDRKILGIQHLYGGPIYARSQEWNIDSPQNGPLPPDAPSWCQAPFDPEGLLSSEKHDTFKMVGSGCPSHVFTNEPTGFLRLLSVIAKIAIGPTTRTEYTFYHHKISDSLTMHKASVHFIGGRPEARRLRFVGRAMPTERQAIKMAAREVIARLRDTLPVMKTRPYHYLPCHVSYTSHYAFACPEERKTMLLGCSCNTS
ncbi:uncharacterized protein LOC123442086 [Hordeum vulgare subsp. vulgare]|uniref:uncharacterized protein LOC123442086 n=1 Tax=Hordeum vulgare subsp. vulgare TaxID=112509 RepID=UPI001D1A587B|nr:uncharacterized protein LOC123442086 [Hordeum vulgare subsp. vulgare]